MPANDAMLFIDANKYLDLYRTDTGKKLLAPLGEQVEHIFVTQRVVDEVQRNKIQVVADYLLGKFKDLKLQTFNVPDHLTGSNVGQGKEILQLMSEIVQKIKKVNDEVDALALGIVEQISRSEDEVSKALTPIFANAVPHSQEELQRARDRRESGNPPGKSDDPLGDQLTWEQILTHFKGKRRLWVISRDGDYGTFFDGRGFLNRFLFEELRKLSPACEVYLFADTVDGIKHFVDTTGVMADKQLTPDEVKEVEKEEKALPPLTPSEGFRRTLAPPLQEMLRLSEVSSEWAKRQEEMRRLSEGVARFVRPTEDILGPGVASQMAKYQEDARRLSEGVAKFVRPATEFLSVGVASQMAKYQEDARRLSEGVAKLIRPAQELMFGGVADQLSKHFEDVRKLYDGVARLAQPSEEVQRWAAEMTRRQEELSRMVVKPFEEMRRFAAESCRPPTLTGPKEDGEQKDEPGPPPPAKNNKEKKNDEGNAE